MTVDKFSNKAEAFDDTPLSPQAGETIGAIIARRYSRRHMLKGSLGVTAATVLFGEVALIGASGPAKAASAGFAFREVTAEVDEKHRVAGRPDRNDFAKITAAHADIEMAAHGVGIVEIALIDGRWRPVTGSPLNRRITAATEMTVDGPAAGHDRLKTKADPHGRKILGTLNNCAGGETPWGTYLTAEENFHGYFWTDEKDADGKRKRKGLGGPQQKSYDRYGLAGRKDQQARWPLCPRDRRRKARPIEAVLPMPGRCGAVRAVLRAG